MGGRPGAVEEAAAAARCWSGVGCDRNLDCGREGTPGIWRTEEAAVADGAGEVPGEVEGRWGGGMKQHRVFPMSSDLAWTT